MKSSTCPAIRGRPREFDPDRALAEALRVFWQRGYEGASMAELTEAMGITKPSLYACFGNKEALFRQALDLYARDKLAYIGKALEAPTAKQVVERLLDGAVATYCGGSDPHGCLGVISSVACGAESHAILDHVATLRRSVEAAIVARFAKAQEQGDATARTSPEALASCVSTVLQGLSVRARAGATRDELKCTVDAFLAMWPDRDAE